MQSCVIREHIHLDIVSLSTVIGTQNLHMYRSGIRHEVVVDACTMLIFAGAGSFLHVSSRFNRSITQSPIVNLGKEGSKSTKHWNRSMSSQDSIGV